MAAPPGLLIKRLTEDYEVGSFRCGKRDVDDFLLNEALLDSWHTTWVVTQEREPFKVIAFYSVYPTLHRLHLSVGETLDVFSLEYLGTDLAWQRKGIGKLLLTRQLRHALYAQERFGIQGVISHPRSEQISRWLRELGFTTHEDGGVFLSVADLLGLKEVLGLTPLEL